MDEMSKIKGLSQNFHVKRCRKNFKIMDIYYQVKDLI